MSQPRTAKNESRSPNASRNTRAYQIWRSLWSARHSRAFAACGLVLLAGCAVGPDYKRPSIDSPSAFRAENAETNLPLADRAWWDVYQDPTLQSLVHIALTNNYDLRIAATRVEQSRALAAQARSQFFPGATYDGTVSRGRNYVFGTAFPSRGATTSSAIATLNAFWELDLWGRVRRLNESARAQLLASEQGRRGVRLSLLSDVATAYFELLELDQELEISSRTTNSFAESLRIFSRRLEEGTASALESSRAQAALEDAAASVPSIRQRISAIENRLCVLLGRNPGPIERPATLLSQTMPEVPPGLPSALLQRRPDVLESEQLLHSANARIGVSVAEFFPTIGLTALLGKVSPELSAFTAGSANAWGIGAQGTGPLFQGGRILSQYKQAKAARDQAELEYRQTVLNSFREVSDALVSRQELAQVRTHLSSQVSSLGTAVKLSSQRYVAGKASYYEVLEAQQQLFPAELNLARTQLDQLLAMVNLYKALGGGWPAETNAVVAEKGKAATGMK
jgi:multidrug efflux system outer membrane protein